MTNIKLNARLKAYSKSPFYDDYIRGVNIDENGQIQQLEPNFLYGLRDGKWQKIFEGDMTEISDRLNSLQEKDISIEEKQELFKDIILKYLNNILLGFDSSINSIVWVGIDGVPTYIRLQVLADNEFVKYDDYNRLTLVRTPDDKTIVKDGYDHYKVESIYTYTDNDGLKHYITGQYIDTNIDNLIRDVNTLQETVSGGSVTLSTLKTNLSTTYAQFENNQITEDELNAQVQYNLCDSAYEYLGIIGESDKDKQLPQGLKIADEYTGILYKWNKNSLGEDVGAWEIIGKELTVVATNNGISGIVVGASWKDNVGNPYSIDWETNDSYLKGHIDNERVITLKDEFGQEYPYYETDIHKQPTISINGLKERLTDLDCTKVEKIDNKDNDLDVVYIQKAHTSGFEQDVDCIDCVGLSEDELADTLVKRTFNGTVKVETPMDLNDATNMHWINEKFNVVASKIKSLTIDKIDDTLYINNDGDVTTQDGYGS